MIHRILLLGVLAGWAGCLLRGDVADDARKPARTQVRLTREDHRSLLLTVVANKKTTWKARYAGPFVLVYNMHRLVVYSSEDGGIYITGRTFDGAVRWRYAFDSPFFPLTFLARGDVLILRAHGPNPGIHETWYKLDRHGLLALDVSKGRVLWTDTVASLGKPVWTDGRYLICEKIQLEDAAIENAGRTGIPLRVWLELRKVRDRTLLHRAAVAGGARRWLVRESGRKLRLTAEHALIYGVNKELEKWVRSHKHSISIAFVLPGSGRGARRPKPVVVGLRKPG